jgi:hypothetical protein
MEPQRADLRLDKTAASAAVAVRECLRRRRQVSRIKNLAHPSDLPENVGRQERQTQDPDDVYLSRLKISVAEE